MWEYRFTTFHKTRVLIRFLMVCKIEKENINPYRENIHAKRQRKTRKSEVKNKGNFQLRRQRDYWITHKNKAARSAPPPATWSFSSGVRLLHRYLPIVTTAEMPVGSNRAIPSSSAADSTTAFVMFSLPSSITLSINLPSLWSSDGGDFSISVFTLCAVEALHPGQFCTSFINACIPAGLRRADFTRSGLNSSCSFGILVELSGETHKSEKCADHNMRGE